METAQVDKDGRVFAVVRPQVQGDPPEGVIFVHFDGTKYRVGPNTKYNLETHEMEGWEDAIG